jgi:hypothetical protein
LAEKQRLRFGNLPKKSSAGLKLISRIGFLNLEILAFLVGLSIKKTRSFFSIENKNYANPISLFFSTEKRLFLKKENERERSYKKTEIVVLV